jgi:hypothetical protein
MVASLFLTVKWTRYSMIKTRQVKVFKLSIAAHGGNYTRCMKLTLWVKCQSLIT